MDLNQQLAVSEDVNETHGQFDITIKAITQSETMHMLEYFSQDQVTIAK